MKTTGINNQRSICENCTTKGACVFEKNAENPIYSCDTYEFSVGVNQTKKEKSKKNRKSKSLYKLGICSDCSNNSACCIRVPGEMKTYCEQYE